MHVSSSRGTLSSRDLPHPRLLQIAFGGIWAWGSSDSSSGGSGLGVVDGVGCWATVRLVEIGLVTGIGAGMGAAATIFEASTAFGFGGAGVSSVAECLPFVQGGISRNSSKVRTRGLQHFQPIQN